MALHHELRFRVVVLMICFSGMLLLSSPLSSITCICEGAIETSITFGRFELDRRSF